MNQRGQNVYPIRTQRNHPNVQKHLVDKYCRNYSLMKLKNRLIVCYFRKRLVFRKYLQRSSASLKRLTEILDTRHECFHSRWFIPAKKLMLCLFIVRLYESVACISHPKLFPSVVWSSPEVEL